MTRLARISFLMLLAIFAIGVGNVLSFSPAVMAAQSSIPDEEEKKALEQDDEVVLTRVSTANPAVSPLQTAVRTPIRPTNSRALPIRCFAFDPAASLNNGLGAFYRC
jgi:hypothetical protein